MAVSRLCKQSPVQTPPNSCRERILSRRLAPVILALALCAVFVAAPASAHPFNADRARAGGKHGAAPWDAANAAAGAKGEPGHKNRRDNSATPAAPPVPWSSIDSRPASFASRGETPSGAYQAKFISKAESADAIPEQFIVNFRHGATGESIAAVIQYLESSPDVSDLRDLGGGRAFVGTFKQPAIDYLLQSPAVELVEQDAKIKLTYFPSTKSKREAMAYEDWVAPAPALASSGRESGTSKARRMAAESVLPPPVFQTNAPWNLDRVDQRSGDLDGVYKYSYNGSGVHIYVIDTGLRTTHVEFTGRVGQGISIIDGGVEDCNGHGTHVSGTAAGTIFGVAKGATIHPVRTLGCDGEGTVSDVIAGVQWVTSNFQAPAVAVMSLGGTVSSALDSAVATSTSAGVVYSVAAGNEDQDACFSSPARSALVATVAATDQDDTLADFSNWGACVDVSAPGVDITSAWYTGDRATNVLSGTSMAAPLVGGLLARLREYNPSITPDALAGIISCSSTKSVIQSLHKSTPDGLAFFAVSEPVVSSVATDNSISSQCDAGTGLETPANRTNNNVTDSKGCQVFRGNLTATALSINVPQPYYQSTFTGTHRGYLRFGPSTDSDSTNGDPTFDAMDLILYKYNDATRTWDVVSASTKTSNDELVVFYGTPGFYTFEVRVTPVFLKQSSLSAVPFTLVVKPPQPLQDDSSNAQCNVGPNSDGSGGASQHLLMPGWFVGGALLVSLLVHRVLSR